jgi:UDP-N-acetylmuramate--alanine ligase
MMMNTLDMRAAASEPVDSRTLELKGRRVHFVGIGGCGMSGLARLVRAAGATVTGTDLAPSATTQSLVDDGISVALHQDAQTVPAECDTMVISAAVREDHPEVAEARRRGVQIVKYAQMLGRMMLGRTGVAIAGTHGKSTTTSMLAHVLIQSGQDPSFIVGATCQQIGGGSRVGRRDLLVAEACEYDRSFHNFHPTHAVILNVEEDHLDIYRGLEEIIESFRIFAQRIVPGGTLLIGHESAQRRSVSAGLDCRVETLGFAPEADWQVEVKLNGGPAKHVYVRHVGKRVCEFECLMPGDHMAYNAAAAAVLAHRVGASWEAIGAALSTFRGLDRRMQLVGTAHGVRVVDDYGHHPTEVDATLRALRAHYRPEEAGGRLICVFQPHQHSRTRFLLDQFAASFSQADVVLVPHIYFVRDSEADRRAVSAADLVHKLQQRGVLAVHIDGFADIVTFLKNHCRPNDLLVVMGAGPVWRVAQDFLNAQ